jgi:hypothetical protein
MIRSLKDFYLPLGGAPIISESSNSIIQKLKDSLPDHRIDEACAKRILALSLVSTVGVGL